MLSDRNKGETRFIEVAFSVLSQAGSDSPRRGLIAAVQPKGSRDVVMLVSSATSSRWKKGVDLAAQQVAESFRVVSTRATTNTRAAATDYRFPERGGLVKGTGDTTETF